MWHEVQIPIDGVWPSLYTTVPHLGKNWMRKLYVLQPTPQFELVWEKVFKDSLFDFGFQFGFLEGLGPLRHEPHEGPVVSGGRGRAAGGGGLHVGGVDLAAPLHVVHLDAVQHLPDLGRGRPGQQPPVQHAEAAAAHAAADQAAGGAGAADNDGDWFLTFFFFFPLFKLRIVLAQSAVV